MSLVEFILKETENGLIIWSSGNISDWCFRNIVLDVMQMRKGKARGSRTS